MGIAKNKILPVETQKNTAPRSQAEEQLRTKIAGLNPPRTKEETQRLVHELEVRQIELEMQNEELSRANKELDEHKRTEEALWESDSQPHSMMEAVFDRDVFVRRNLGDLVLSRNVATIFIDSVPEYIKSIRNAVAAKDAVALRHAAHKLKGSAANLALPQLSEIARMIESAAEAGDLEKGRDLLQELELQFGQAEDALREALITPQRR